MSTSKISRVEMTRRGDKVKIRVFAEGQRGAKYLLKSGEFNQATWAADVQAAKFWEGIAVDKAIA